MVESETKSPLFSEKNEIRGCKTLGDLPEIQEKMVIDMDKYSRGNTSCRRIRHRELAAGDIRLEKEFLFGIVENGSATVAEGDREREREIRRGDVLILSPSRSCGLGHATQDFDMTCIVLRPDFFDTLPDAQAMYNQLTRRGDDFRPPVLRTEAAAYDQLRKTAALFTDALECFANYREGIIRHLSSLFLLQLADVLHHGDEEPPIGVKRTDKLFRQFKMLSVEHFRTHHDIAFYADRLHVSTTYLSRIVKRTTGHTVHDHLAELLCAEARKELASTGHDIKEIADRLGFADQSSFGKFFRSRTGLSPTRYRQRFARQ